MKRLSGPSIADLSTAVFDNGRRGEPKNGCDCVQCFGYCIVDSDQAVRDQALRNDGARRPMQSHATPVALDFAEAL